MAKRQTTQTTLTAKHLQPREAAKALRSAASALEHGRHATAQKKVRGVLDIMHEQYVEDSARPDSYNVAVSPKLAEHVRRFGKDKVLRALGAGPLESLTLRNHCELCGHDNQDAGYAPLEAAFESLGQAKTLCAQCRMGCAELTHERFAELLRAVEAFINHAAHRMMVPPNLRLAIDGVKGKS